MESDVSLRVTSLPGRTRDARDDWDAIRAFVRKAGGEWCQVLVRTEPRESECERARARLYQRAKYNLRGGDFEVTSRVERTRVRVFARAVEGAKS